MKKLLQNLTTLTQIDELVRDTSFIATQEAIATELQISVRTVRSHFRFLKEVLYAPLIIHGVHSSGWEYQEDWNLWDSLKEAVSKDLDCHNIK